jgi:hypothetical protein
MSVPIELPGLCRRSLETRNRTNARCARNQKKQQRNCDARAKDDDERIAEGNGTHKRVT